jgi:hypothetical protein
MHFLLSLQRLSMMIHADRVHIGTPLEVRRSHEAPLQGFGSGGAAVIEVGITKRS